MKTHFFKVLILLLFLLSFGFWLRAQQIIVSPMPFQDKLSVNSIFNLYQDKKGFIWLGTVYGLERYDGYDIQPFINNYKNPHKLTHNDIRCFAEDDNYLWVGTLQGINLIHKDTYQIIPFLDSKLQKKEIRDLFCDWRGNIWVAAEKSLYRCDAQLGVLKEYPLKNDTNTFFEDRDGDLWLLTWNGEILKYDKPNDLFVKYAQMQNSNPYRMTQDNNGRYWIVTWGSGIWRFDPNSKEKEKMFLRQSIINPIRHSQEQVFYDIVQDDTYGYLWALSHFRLYVFQINERNELEEVDINSLNDKNRAIDQYKTYSRVLKDSSGNLWLGAYDQGCTIAFEKAEVVNQTMENIRSKLGIDANILYFNKDSKGIIWCDQSRYGLCLFDEQTGKITYGNNEDALYSIVVTSIVPSKKEDAVWLGGRNDYSTHLWKMRQEGMRLSTLEEFDLNRVVASPGNITQLVEDKYGNIWIGTTNYLFFKQVDSQKIIRLPFDINHVNDMSVDGIGNVWVCSHEGIYQMTYRNKPILLKHYPKEFISLQEDPIKKISAESGSVWFSTYLGRLLQLEPQSGKITEQTEVCDLNGDNILKILSWKDKIWIVCDKYIICHDKRYKENTIYSVDDANILVSSFRHSAAFIDKEGCLYAGGHNGFIKILPNGRTERKNKHRQVLISDVKCENRSVLFSPVGAEIGNSVREITLLPDARNIEIIFSAVSYTSNRRIRYAYLLEGVDKKWTYIENGKHSAFYNYLDKGEYVFRIKATDPYGNWMKGEQQIIIYRLPAWYETWYAYTLYALVIMGFIYFLFYAYNKRITRKNKLKLQEELTQVKLNYFTNISHELMTPLTILSCVADDLDENKESTERQVEILRSNVSRLKRLLQQILDFRKVESSKMGLNVGKCNISSFVSGIVTANFQSLAQKKGISLITDIEGGIWGYLDVDKLDKILFNLLSNAIKYTAAHKKIKVNVELVYKEGSRFLKLRVEDEGIGIAEKDVEHIFTKFYNNRNHQGYKSNGIGLSLTKELITIHHGTIELDSEMGKGSTFCVEMPIDKEAYNDQEIIDASLEDIQEESDYTTTDDDKLSILFIDDSRDLRELMYRIFNKKYHVSTAENGLEGLEILRNNVVDIIICDVMMPQMDGLEFCRQVKNDVQTNHIPIIMLTAKNATDDQIECYKSGAESYISKPFDMKILQARIENLLQKRELSKQRFRSKMEVNISNLDYQSADEQFLNDAIECVKRHIQDVDFDTVQMAFELHISRSTLSRKFRVITGCTPLEFIRNIKLKYACSLLDNKVISISEVAYAIGFSTPKYFTKCFKEEFGMTPTEYQNK
ncbi:response regulator [uncultured Bacteroides sp.]|uniref:response regulator n=1 Tax=uncultured Bacteroides sp. TaxID=162156 RepID=UPI00280B6053|nr:response regulator [uncultured Bacteroides sp.]